MVRTGDPHPACEGGGIGGYFIETDEKDKKGSGDQKIAKKKAFADEESAGNHEQDADDLKGEAKVINPIKAIIRPPKRNRMWKRYLRVNIFRSLQRTATAIASPIKRRVWWLVIPSPNTKPHSRSHWVCSGWRIQR